MLFLGLIAINIYMLTVNGKYHGSGTPNSPGMTASTYHVTRRYNAVSDSNIIMAVSKEKLLSTVGGL